MSVFITSGGTYEVEPDVVTTPEDDFDTIVSHVVRSAGSLTAVLAVYDKGNAHPDFSNMRVVDRNFHELVCGTGRYEGYVTYRGITINDHPFKFQIETYGERTTYDSIFSPSSPFVAAPHDVSQARLGLTVRYISTSRPDTDAVGTAVVPPNGPGGGWNVPENVFDFYSDVILAYPDGWVLEHRSGPNIPGHEIWMVEDAYVYYQPWRPRG
ncbi:hypothetical protein AYO49_05650 [Verrucomicrobiaceae bacterium SCGC AG-212-N21]|nr:hypothetical protein AYO49_05650 [Verrucomicrobiaceae bacterium SCGC AG-212-N21]